MMSLCTRLNWALYSSERFVFAFESVTVRMTVVVVSDDSLTLIWFIDLWECSH